jgi:hypothetical protein|tara:strand:- start:6502 stop:7953 length:1452 start_codon:yes stop_codon:yes gene_type:complete
MAARPILRRKPLRYQNVGRKSSLKQSLSLTGLDPNLKNVGSFAFQFKKLTVEQRNQMIRYLSDYVSEEIGLGKKVKNKNIFTSPEAAPDGEIQLDDFERQTGIRLSQTQVLKGAAAQNLGFFETKVTGGLSASGGENIALGAISVSKAVAPQQFAAIRQRSKQLGQKGFSGVDAYNFLTKSPAFADKWNKVLAQINEKFENLLVVNVIDAEKGGKRVQLDFVKNPLRDFNAFNASSFLENFSLTFKESTVSEKVIDPNTGLKVKTGKRIVTRYKIETAPKAKLRNSFKKADITNKFIKAHSRAFSKGIELYLIKRIQRYQKEASSKPNEQIISNLMGFAVALAREFQEGGQTPLTLQSKIQTPNMNITPGRLTVTGDKPSKTQKFISGAQISALVRRRLGDKMPSGPRRGPPLSGSILTERSGRFRSSVQVIPDYRRSVMAFFYDPIYKVFVGTERDPDEFVGDTVREVVQGLYSRAFKILRV